MMRRPPKFVQGFIDRHGKPRFYIRRAGYKRVPLPGLPWSPEFMSAYEQALAGQPAHDSRQAGKPGSIRALAAAYFQSSSFRTMEARTQRVYRNVIERFCERQDKDNQKLGDKPAGKLEREHVVRLMAANIAKPEAANMLRRVLRAIMKCAVDLGLRKDDPTRDVKALPSKTEGFHTWTIDEVHRFEQRHPIGTKARLALALMLYIGQRRSDIIQFGRQHVKNGWLKITQHKNRSRKPITIEIPVLAELQSIIDASTCGDLTFLVTEFGRPFTPNGFGNWFRDRCIEAGVPGRAHGLRKATATRLAEVGASDREIMAVTGHQTSKEVDRYTKAARRKVLAESAMARMAGTKIERK